MAGGVLLEDAHEAAGEVGQVSVLVMHSRGR